MLRYKEYTNLGCREINEDKCGVAYEGDSYCFVVADGLGGHGNGEVASQIAVETICTTFIEEGYTENFFEHALGKAQEQILERQVQECAPSKMKTTVVILVIHENKAYWAHIGDSRLYMFKNLKLKTRTIDHSVPQLLALSGDIKEKEIRYHPDRNRLMRVLGVKGENPKYEQNTPIKLAGKQAFLLCTDGYWELIEEEQMENLLKVSATPEEWIEKMNAVVQENGVGKDMDNNTAIAVFSEKGKWFW